MTVTILNRNLIPANDTTRKKEWKYANLQDFLTFQRGFDITKKDMKEGEYDVIFSSGFGGKHSEYKIKAPGVVIGRKGTLGKVFFVEKNFWATDTTLWVKDFHGNNPKFAYYFLQTLHLEQFDCGSANPTLNRNHIHALSICYPPLSTQRKIASILSAYDDLIENNTRRIKILEEMAQMLYREWFVNFRFPNHENIKMVESELGLIPEGWEVKPIGEVIETTGGGTPSTKIPEYWENGNIFWYTPSDLTASKSMFISSGEKAITRLGLQKSSARMFPAYSVMMTSRATIGVTAINTEPACTNQGFITCIPNEFVSAYQIYFWVAENKDTIISFASGATFKEISKTVFRQLPILIAEKKVRNQFVTVIDPICKHIANLQQKNINLRKTRDLLLPKLISGEIDLEKLNIETLEIAA
jgi:type I restriction enzyme, S subunit